MFAYATNPHQLRFSEVPTAFTAITDNSPDWQFNPSSYSCCSYGQSRDKCSCRHLKEELLLGIVVERKNTQHQREIHSERRGDTDEEGGTQGQGS
jgi:hypothetical protein